MPSRRKLGTTYTKSPAQRIGAWARNNTTSLIYSILWSIGFHVVLFVVICIVRLLGTEIAGWWDPERTNAVQIFNSAAVLPIRVLGVIGCFIYVFRDNLTKR